MAASTLEPLDCHFCLDGLLCPHCDTHYTRFGESFFFSAHREILHPITMEGILCPYCFGEDIARSDWEQLQQWFRGGRNIEILEWRFSIMNAYLKEKGYEPRPFIPREGPAPIINWVDDFVFGAKLLSEKKIRVSAWAARPHCNGKDQDAHKVGLSQQDISLIRDQMVWLMRRVLKDDGLVPDPTGSSKSNKRTSAYCMDVMKDIWWDRAIRAHATNEPNETGGERASRLEVVDPTTGVTDSVRRRQIVNPYQQTKSILSILLEAEEKENGLPALWTVDPQQVSEHEVALSEDEILGQFEGLFIESSESVKAEALPTHGEEGGHDIVDEEATEIRPEASDDWKFVDTVPIIEEICNLVDDKLGPYVQRPEKRSEPLELTTSDIVRAYSVKLKEKDIPQMRENKCLRCWTPWEEGMEVVMPDCQHAYDFECMKVELESREYCPLCRREYNFSMLEDLPPSPPLPPFLNPEWNEDASTANNLTWDWTDVPLP
ncbi:hypothetical protein M501DRAFT_987092 [Patellaria atrata CBS 101060]|uniref:RING-type domain-containing protein n=1 Tax=Patellaria atrata CBS 101060 TaxID=1346257 RepID=A0A9P4S7T2_9PEZI|nr:hypothetical protein M501DRAFT_987092 [Patellaria atrata CBS 101060]